MFTGGGCLKLMESKIRELELSKIEKEIKDKEQELKRLKDKYNIS